MFKKTSKELDVENPPNVELRGLLGTEAKTAHADDGYQTSHSESSAEDLFDEELYLASERRRLQLSRENLLSPLSSFVRSIFGGSSQSRFSLVNSDDDYNEDSLRSTRVWKQARNCAGNKMCAVCTVAIVIIVIWSLVSFSAKSSEKPVIDNGTTTHHNSNGEGHGNTGQKTHALLAEWWSLPRSKQPQWDSVFVSDSIGTNKENNDPKLRLNLWPELAEVLPKSYANVSLLRSVQNASQSLGIGQWTQRQSAMARTITELLHMYEPYHSALTKSEDDFDSIVALAQTAVGQWTRRFSLENTGISEVDDNGEDEIDDSANERIATMYRCPKVARIFKAVTTHWFAAFLQMLFQKNASVPKTVELSEMRDYLKTRSIAFDLDSEMTAEMLEELVIDTIALLFAFKGEIASDVEVFHTRTSPLANGAREVVVVANKSGSNGGVFAMDPKSRKWKWLVSKEVISSLTVDQIMSETPPTIAEESEKVKSGSTVEKEENEEKDSDSFAPNRIPILTVNDLIGLRRFAHLSMKYKFNTANEPSNEGRYTGLKKAWFLAMDSLLNWKTEMIRHAYFHLIHVSKSAGTSICQTARYSQVSTPLDSCNLEPFGKPVGTADDTGSFTCKQALAAAGFDHFSAKESPMTAHMVPESVRSGDSVSEIVAANGNVSDLDNSKLRFATESRRVPYLCPQMQYIVPIRSPIEKAISWLRQMNMNYNFPFAMLRRRNTSDPKWMEKFDDYMCTDNTINAKIDNEPMAFTKMKEAKDIRGFVYAVLRNCVDAKGKVRSTPPAADPFEDTKLHLDQCSGWHITSQWNGGIRLYLLYDESDELSLVWKTVDTFAHRMNLQHFRGYLSNIYTRWLGLAHNASRSNRVHDTVFTPVWQVSADSFLNAVETLLRINYVLPFANENARASKSGLAHEMWSVVFDLLEDFAQTTLSTDLYSTWTNAVTLQRFGKNALSSKDLERSTYPTEEAPTDWGHERDSTSDEHFGTAQLMSYLSAKEWTLLRTLNAFDFELYNLSKVVADSDIEFYKQLSIVIEL